MKRDDVNGFLRQHAIDPADVMSVTFTPDAYCLELAVKDRKGRKQVAPNGRDLLVTHKVQLYEEAES